MTTRLRSILAVLLFLIVGIAPFSLPALIQRTAAQDPVVHVVLFHMPSCPHCHEVIENVLPGLKERYGDRLRIQLIDVTSDVAYEAFARYLQSVTKTQTLYGVPTMVIGDTVLIGSFQIPAEADGVIAGYLAKGGVEPAPLPAVLDGPDYMLEVAPGKTPTPVAAPPTARPTPADPEGALIHMAYFYQPGCQECDQVQMALGFLQSRYPQLRVTAFDVKEYAALNEWMGQRAGVPEAKRLTAPSVFVGEDALVGDQLFLGSLEALIAKYQATGAARVWEDFHDAEAAQSIIARFYSLGTLTVMGAGLLDGLNPCAFATLVFFVSYLTFSGRKGRDVLLVGGAFALGVFLTYLVVGLGLWKALGTFGFLTKMGRWFYILTAALCFGLAVFSLLDYFKARQGQVEEMTLKLPRALRKRINAVIRTGQQTRAFVPVAFVTGAVISLIELACTGQVYLPTIIFVLSVPELQSRAVAYLLLYNICFILPLIVVFLLVYYGTTPNQLSRLVRTHTATVKLGTALLFLVLGLWLTYSILA